MAKLKNKISFFVLPIFFTCLLLTFFMFNNNVSVLADNTISADETTNNSFSVIETAENLTPVGVCVIYDDVRAASNEYYIGGLHFVFNIDNFYLNEAYEYGWFYASYDVFLTVLQIDSAETDYIKKFDTLGAPYSTSTDTFMNYNTIHNQCWLNISFYEDEAYETPPSTSLEERLNRQFIVFMYVKNSETNEIAYTDPIIGSYDSCLNGVNSDLDYYKGLSSELTRENLQLTAELEELKNNNSASTFVKIMIGACGIIVLLGIIVSCISGFSKKKPKRH